MQRAVPDAGAGVRRWEKGSKRLKVLGKIGIAGAEDVVYLLKLPRSICSLWAILAFSGVVKYQACRMAGDEKETFCEGFQLMS